MKTGNVEKTEKAYNHGLSQVKRLIIRMGWGAYRDIVGLEGERTRVTKSDRGICATRSCRVEEWGEAKSIISAGIEMGLTEAQIEKRISNYFKLGRQ